MTQEEKAKAYDRAIEKIQKYVKDDYGCTRLRPEDIFPELKESEDEKIRRLLMQNLKERFGTKGNMGEGLDMPDVLAWLEKQGEQKETLCDKCKKTQPSHSCQDITALGRCALEKQGEQKLTEFEKAVKQVMEEAIECGDTHNLKADAEMLLSLIHKSAWSGEDEKKVNNLYVLLDQMVSFNMLSNKDATEFKDWLKALKNRVQPQNTWEPSDEQMNTLEHYMHTLVCNEHKEILFGLYSDLKKLRGE